MNKPISTPATTVCHASPSGSEGPAMCASPRRRISRWRTGRNSASPTFIVGQIPPTRFQPTRSWAFAANPTSTDTFSKGVIESR